ncbi:MAG: hypothetical protein ABIH46_13400 [Chloroflexota bacterium]
MRRKRGNQGAIATVAAILVVLLLVTSHSSTWAIAPGEFYNQAISAPVGIFGDVSLSESQVLLPILILALVLVAGGAYVLLRSRGAPEEPPDGEQKP